MKLINRIIITSLCISQLLIFSLEAQPQSTSQTKSGKESAHFHLFFEKVYLHLDRDYYSSGDDIWYKAYLVNGQSNWLTNTSNNLYVELISPESKLLKREVIRLDQGTGTGDFKLGDSIPDGKYRIRAYTQWMKNFYDYFVFEKDITVHSLLGIKTKINQQSTVKKESDIEFFPEGGSLISDVQGMVAFKAVDESGKGIKANGMVVSSDGDTISYFESMHLGMGMFSFIPLNGKKYYAVGTLDNAPFKKELPEILPVGYVMRVINLDTASLIVNISTNSATFQQNTGKTLVLSGQSYGKSCFTNEFKLTNQTITLKVPKSYFPQGIACITLYDDHLHPQCERLDYIEGKEKINVALISDKAEYKPKEKVNLTIKTTDEKQNPVKANLSLSVVDASQVPVNTSDIVSYLNLESEVKGKIENPMEYFDQANSKRLKLLDLLLMTQGWRDFVWHRLADSTIRIKYLMEQGINLTGRVREKFVNKGMPNLNVSMFLPGAKKNKLMSSLTDSTGKYEFDGVEFYGNKRVILTSRSLKNKNTGWIFLDSLYKDPLPIPFRKFSDRENSPELIHFDQEADSRQTIARKYKLSDTIKLNEVVIAGNGKKSQEQIKNHFLEGGTADYDFTITDKDYNNYNITSFLINHVPGANLDPANNRVTFRNMGETISPRIVLDGLTLKDDNDEVDIAYNLAMEQIDRILISRKDFNSTNPMAGWVISIYSKQDAFQKKEFYTLNNTIPGYYQARVFYSPKYNNPNEGYTQSDLRTTIYWNPNILTNENGESTVNYFNPNQLTKGRIIVEGVTEKGIPVEGTVSYNIK